MTAWIDHHRVRKSDKKKSSSMDWKYQDEKLIEERFCRKVVPWIEDLFGGRQNRWGRVWANRKMRARFVNFSFLFCKLFFSLGWWGTVWAYRKMRARFVNLSFLFCKPFFFGVMGNSVSKQKDESQVCKIIFFILQTFFLRGDAVQCEQTERWEPGL